MSYVLELVGFALLALAAFTLAGAGAAEVAGGLELLFVAQALDGVSTWKTTKERARKVAGRWATKTPPPAE